MAVLLQEIMNSKKIMTFYRCFFHFLLHNIQGQDPLGIEDKLDIFIQRKTTRYEGWNFNSGNYLFATDTK